MHLTLPDWWLMQYRRVVHGTHAHPQMRDNPFHDLWLTNYERESRRFEYVSSSYERSRLILEGGMIVWSFEPPLRCP